MNEKLSIVLVTFPNNDQAPEMAEVLVREKLCACVNIVPALLSTYVWEGSLCKENEVLLIIKTVTERIPALEQRVSELHPYKVPEFVVLDSTYVSKKYMEWVVSVTNIPNK